MSLKAGVSRVCITPPFDIPLGGTFVRPFPQSVHDDLWARCLFLENDGTRIAIVTADLLGLRYDLIDKVAARLKKSIGLRADELVLHCTHCHSGPDVTAIIHEPLDHPYMDDLAKDLAQMVREAASNLRPAKAGWAVGRLEGICTNRRIRVADGKVRMNWEAVPEEEIVGRGPIDPDLGVLRVDDADGKPLAALIHYTCHPAIISPAPEQISADYPGIVSRMVERLWGEGTTALFVNGAFGNINHIMRPSESDAMTAGVTVGRPFEEAERVGQPIAHHALQLLHGVRTADQSLGLTSKRFPTANRRPPVENAVEAKVALVKEQMRFDNAMARGDERAMTELRINMTYMEHWGRMWESMPEESEMRLSAFRIGDLGVACIPGEPFVEIGFAIKQASPLEPTWVLGNTNGYTGYMPTEESFPQGGYEVRTCCWSHWREDTDGIVAETSVELLERLRNE